MFINLKLGKAKYLFGFMVLLCAVLWSSITVAQSNIVVFPYGETFKGTTATGMVFGKGDAASSAAYLTANPDSVGVLNADVVGAGYLRLTKDEANQSGFARNTTAFPSKYGVSVSFEYYTWHGDPQPPYYGFADGISFFLFDATASGSFNIGGFGGSLGYAQRNTPTVVPGLSKGFLGIGLDEFGNFSTATEGRQGGNQLGGAPNTLDNQMSVSLRGDGDGSAGTADNYEFLTHKRTDGHPDGGSDPVDNGAFELIGKIAGKTTYDANTRPTGGLLPTEAGFRKAKIEIMPWSGGVNGGALGALDTSSVVPPQYRINVWITEGAATPKVHHVIQNYIYTPTNTAPATFSYGFAASTGGFTDAHDIRAIDIAIPPDLEFRPNPLGDVAISTNEDTAYPFKLSDFTSQFKDPNGFESLASINIYNLPSAAQGILKINNTAITEGQSIPISSITGLLTGLNFVPATDFNGAVNLTTIKWAGTDDTGLTIIDDSYRGNVNITVNPVNDAPGGADKTVNTAINTDYVFTASDFGFADHVGTNENHTFTSLTITTTATAGTLFVDLNTNGNIDGAGEILTDGETVASGDFSKIKFRPDNNASGNGYASFTFQVQDSGGTTPGVDQDPIANTITINVQLNAAPTSANATVTLLEDAAFQLIPNTKFAFTDSNLPAQTFLEVEITQAPLAGTLFNDVNGNNLADLSEILIATSVISKSDLDLGRLKYKPLANENGSGYGNFKFKVRDNGGTAAGGADKSIEYTMTVDVTPVNDEPTFVKGIDPVVLDEDAGPQTIAGWATSISKGPANESGQVLTFTITNISVPGLFSTPPSIDPSTGNLTFTGAAGEIGTGTATMDIILTDNGAGTNPDDNTFATQTLTITINPVNDPPVVTVPVSNVVIEDTPKILTGISFADVDAASGTVVATLSVPASSGTLSATTGGSVTVGGSGTLSLTLTGTLANINAFITGGVTYTPVPQSTADVTLTVSMNDNGNTGSGGAKSHSQTMLLDLTPVNDAPIGTDKTITILEDTPRIFAEADFGFTDPNDASPNTFTAVQIVSTPGQGTLRLGGSSVANGQTIPVASLGQLVYTPLPDKNGTAYATFTFRVQDNGGTSPGVDMDATARTMTINVTPVNDAPDFTNGTDQIATATVVARTVSGWATNMITGPASATDETGQTLTFTVTNDNNPLFSVQPAISANGTLTYTPSGTTGIANLIVFVKDNGLRANGGEDQSANKTFKITINAVPSTNTAPSVTNITKTGLKNTTVQFTASNFNVAPFYTDPESDPLTKIKIATLPSNGTLKLSGANITAGQEIPLAQLGNITFDPANNYVGSAITFEWNGFDGTTYAAANANVNISISAPGNNPPDAVNDSATTPEDTPVEVSVLDNDTDPDIGDILTVTSAVLNTGSGTVSVSSSNKKITFTPAADFVGTATVNYTISDGHGGTDDAVVTIVITENRSIAVNVTEVCINDVPWVQYSVTGTGFTPAANSVLVQWRKLDGTVVRELTNQPLTGQLLWPGAVVDGNGKPTAWPGWDFVGGQWVQIADGLRPQMKMYIKVNPEKEVVVNYPPATPFCSANPNLPPVAGDDVASTPKGTPVVISVKTNDTDPDGTIDPATIDLDPTTSTEDKILNKPEGTYVANNDGTITFTPVSTYTGTPTPIHYTIKDNKGLVSNQATVTITVTQPNQPPLVADITKTGGYLPIPFTLADFTGKYSDPEGTPLSKVKIAGLPANGTLKLSGVNVITDQEIPASQLANLTFTPTVNWSGSTTFPWNGSDGALYAVSNANVNITVTLPTDPTAKIGVAKKLVSVTDGLNGSYVIRYQFNVVNYGLYALENISLQDNLAMVFAGTKTTVNAVVAYGNLKANTAYNGGTVTEMLLPSSRLLSGEEAQVDLEINVQLQLNGGLFNNTAIAEGYSSVTGFKVTDKSTNGLKPDSATPGDVSPSDATPVELSIKTTFVPEGFSPNGDGINDTFYIQNALNKNVALEIFNRWGNRVYKSNEYRNDWSGRCTEGFFVGRDIPDGTYFYVIVIDKKDKYSGYITINR